MLLVNLLNINKHRCSLISKAIFYQCIAFLIMYELQLSTYIIAKCSNVQYNRTCSGEVFG